MRQSASLRKSKAERPPLDVGALRTYLRLLAYARPHWPMFLLGVLGMVLFASVDTGFAILVKKFLDGAFVERDPRMLVYVPGGIIALFLVRGVGDYLSVFAPGSVGRQVIKSIRRDLFMRYLQLPVSYFDRNGVGQLLSRLTYNIELVAEAATNAITFIIRDTLTIIGLLSYLIYLNWKLTLFALVVAPPIVGLIRLTSHLFRRYSGRIQASMGDVTRVAKESLESQRMIKVFNAEAQQLEIFEAVNEHNRASFMKLITVKAVSNPGGADDRRGRTRRRDVRGDPGRPRRTACPWGSSRRSSRRSCSSRPRSGGSSASSDRCSRVSRPGRACSRSWMRRPKTAAATSPSCARAARSSIAT